MLIAQLAISQTDTTKLGYPRIGYPGEILKDTCVEFTPLQAKLAAIDGINADSYKQEKDSLKSVVNDYQKFVNLKNNEISQLNFDIKVRNNIIDGYKEEGAKFKAWWVDSDARLHLTKTVDKVVYPILGGGILATIVYIAVNSLIHK